MRCHVANGKRQDLTAAGLESYFFSEHGLAVSANAGSMCLADSHVAHSPKAVGKYVAYCSAKVAHTFYLINIPHKPLMCAHSTSKACRRSAWLQEVPGS